MAVGKFCISPFVIVGKGRDSISSRPMERPVACIYGRSILAKSKLVSPLHNGPAIADLDMLPKL